jgi:NitT/TauT family transport system ATP-binding protein
LFELAVENLTKVFPNGRTSHVVMDGLNFQVKKGEFVSIVGPSGCGKSTLLNIIAGFLRPSNGRVLVDGKPVSAPGPDRAFVFQNYALFPWMTVRNNILYPMKSQKIPRKEREQQLKYLLSLVHMEEKGDVFPQQLSGGMKQRIGVIRALACHPRVLLMDEPLGALDMHMRRKLQEDLEDLFLQDSLTVMMVTHDVDEAVFLSDRIIVMSENEGQIMADISVDMDRPRNRKERRYQELIIRLSDILEDSFEEGRNNRERKFAVKGLALSKGDYSV